MYPKQYLPYLLYYTINARGDVEKDISTYTTLWFIASNIVTAKCVCTYNDGTGVVTVTHNVSYRGNNLPSRQSYLWISLMKGLRRQLHLYLVVSTIIYLAALSAVSLEQWTENQCRYKDSRQVLGRGGASASASVGRCVVLCPWPGLRNSPGLGGCLCGCRHPCWCYRLPTNYLLWAELGWGDIPQCGGGESDGRDRGQCSVMWDLALRSLL